MSFGERAALEGVLAQLKPALALEIGSAEGGSLKRIAAHSSEVHSIDVDHEAISGELPSHVHLHTGDSAELLAPLLTSFVASARLLDFALVDGDHSFEGVRHDLITLLSSPATQRSVILVHDTMNAEVRAGIESVSLDDYPEVVYYELEFVPGYVYGDGECRGSAWGGIGLVLTDTERSPDYPLGPRQSRYLEMFSVVQRATNELGV
jgi:cephalosporin hydroxylase